MIIFKQAALPRPATPVPNTSGVDVYGEGVEGAGATQEKLKQPPHRYIRLYTRSGGGGVHETTPHFCYKKNYTYIISVLYRRTVQ